MDENKITFFLYCLLIKANKKITGICSQIVAFTSCIVLIKLHKFHREIDKRCASHILWSKWFNGGGGGSLLHGAFIHSFALSPHTKTRVPLILTKYRSHPFCIVRQSNTFHQWIVCLWHCPPLYRAAIREVRQKEREASSKTVSAQWITFSPLHRRMGADPCQAMT